jgi:hypothetical protein
MIACADKDDADESERCQKLDDLLAGLFLSERPSAQPPLQQFWILSQEVEDYRHGRCEIHRQEGPRLPVVQRSRQSEQYRRHGQEKE